MKKFIRSSKIVSKSKSLYYYRHNHNNNHRYYNDNEWTIKDNFYSTYASSKTARFKSDKDIIYDFRSDTGIYIYLINYIILIIYNNI